jgi:hypothetical protein
MMELGNPLVVQLVELDGQIERNHLGLKMKQLEHFHCQGHGSLRFQ